ncbi:hypothetical protein RCE24_22140 [Klebsiella variicola subsp. variicola]|uniref:hypothetical protein n=1 Tax=Klebsiella variicola TaxID=244366 RepID=UPI0027E00EA9|nr:hypothetical protein [Klebsiella variicola]MDQ5183747.1 hypothetical protein [Klebsiella variicola subsp. variicola]MDQ5272079.1 hypothetical protein [Klebsiella variicola subsp. variicola]
MKSVRYFTLNYTGFTTAACEKQGYLRLIAGEHVFYIDKRYFKDPALFDRLTINQPLHLGVRRLDNGCYWIHWLSDGETLLEPSQRVTRWARPLLIISLLTLIVALIPLVMSTSEWGRFGCGIIAILAFIGLLTGLYERLFHPTLKWHPAMRDLLTKMAQARRRDFSFCQPLDRLVAVYERDSRAIHALYNASDGAAYIKNHPLYPGRRQLALLYYLFYGLALVMYLLFLAVELISALQSGRSVWWQVQDSLDMLSLLLLSFGGILAVLELIGPTAWLLSHRVADWLKMRSAMRRYLQGVARHTTLEEIM